MRREEAGPAPGVPIASGLPHPTRRPAGAATIDGKPMPEGFVAPGYEPVRDAFERNFAERGEARRGLCRFPRRRARRRSLGRHCRPGERTAVAGGYAPAHLLRHQGSGGALRPDADRSRQAPPRRSRQPPLAGFRQAGDPRPSHRVAYRTATRHRDTHRHCRPHGRPANGGDPRRPGAQLRSAGGAVLSRAHLWLALRRTGPPGRRPERGHFLCRGSGWPARHRVLDRPSRG